MFDQLRALRPVLLVFALLLALWWGFGQYLDRQARPNMSLATGPGAAQRVVLESSPGGHYYAPGLINGQRVRFVVDTGASDVAVSGAAAARLGLTRGRRLRVETAAGRTAAYATRIDRLTVGGITARNVAGSINPAMDSGFILLGMSFLRNFDLSQRDGRLIIKPPD